MEAVGRRRIHSSLRDGVFQSVGHGDDWDYQSVPQPGTADRRHRLPRGRVLGGTSAINGMVYLRGAREDFDGWEQSRLHGLGLGSRAHVLRATRRTAAAPTVPDEHNGLSDVFIAAAMEAGFRFNSFFDDGDLDGCGWNRLSIHRGERHSSYRAFVEPVLGRPNLQVHHELDGRSGGIVGSRRRDRRQHPRDVRKRPSTRRRGGGRVRRCLRVATSLDGVRNRTGAAPTRSRHRRRGRPPRRRQPPRPPPGRCRPNRDPTDRSAARTHHGELRVRTFLSGCPELRHRDLLYQGDASSRR